MIIVKPVYRPVIMTLSESVVDTHLTIDRDRT